MNKSPIKCKYCGKFIKYQDIIDGKAIFNFTPDTEFTIENEYYTHLGCPTSKKETKKNLALVAKTIKEMTLEEELELLESGLDYYIPGSNIWNASIKRIKEIKNL